MRKYPVIVIISLPFLAIAQNETDIRKYYTEINKQITESVKEGYEGSLYNNQWVSNKNGKSWPAVGIYTETTDFWYTDPPDHISAEERNPKTVLVKVNITRRASHLLTNEEYLYKDGHLIFYFSKENEEGNQWETRMYFNNKAVMFKNSVKANEKELTEKDFTLDDYKDFKPNAARVLADSKKYQDLFIKSM